MIKGIWSSMSGMLPRELHHSVAATNIANITTTGYKASRAFLKSFIDAETAAEANSDKNQRISDVEEIHTDFSQGLMEQTDNVLDVAILGDGFFCIDTPQGELYTRNGNFRLDKNYRLVTSDGMPVLGENNRSIKLYEGSIFVMENGEISINGERVAKLKIVDFAEPTDLKRGLNSLFIPMDENVRGMPGKDYKIKHGFLERSNVVPVQEMMNMIIYFRNYEADSRILTAQDDTLRRAVNDIARPV